MPSVRIIWAKRARTDFNELLHYYLQVTDADTTIRIATAINSRVEYLAQNPMIGKTVEALGEPYYYWYVLDSKYRIYFKRPYKTNPNSIKVLRIYSSKRKPLKPQDIV